MMIRDALLPEFDHEMGTTRRLLERVPEDKLNWQPHEKSMTLGRLATHIAEIPNWAQTIIKDTVFEMDSESFTPKTAASRAELLKTFDDSVTGARALVAGATDAELLSSWTMKSGGHEVLSMPKAAVWRSFVMNHGVHHRGQLSVYLRENNVPIPSIYGPSADEQ
jgi:uncharacterized damage-inducible protein DinB